MKAISLNPVLRNMIYFVLLFYFLANYFVINGFHTKVNVANLFVGNQDDVSFEQKELIEGIAAPINLHWGYENRTTGLRVPDSSPQARRVENRFPGADANPYLAIAVSLACGYLGMA